ncbi:MAG TPA: class I tRNA ligase family protein, partial [Spirochaetota bacterium]|nr:class I tRNA ligase family protein [Spirochaetota bacterium]
GNALSVTKGWIEQGLKKRCITRDLKWGVPVPLKGYENKVFYVWFDAPIGYISITASKYDNWEEWWKNPENVDLYQFMGKDNIPFHTVLFPASLFGTKRNWTTLKTISSTEYLNYEDLKFSKSRGTGVFGDMAKDTGIESDLFRYYLLRIRPEKSDTQFFWNDFMEKANGEIIANFANLANRVFQFIDRFFDGVAPAFSENGNSLFSQVDIKKEVKLIIRDFEDVELKKALLDILALSSVGNKFFQDKAPWVLVKTDKQAAGDIIGSLTALVKDLSILLSPFIPTAVDKIFDILNIGKDKLTLDNIGEYSYIKGVKINKPVILFNKLEKEKMEELREKFAGNKNAKNKSGADPFSKIYLKVGKIVEIKKHPKADKLFIEKIDLGSGDVRQIVSGLAPYYKEEELLNKKVVVVANLKEAVLRGEPSKGMLLAAENKDKSVVEVIFPDGEIGEIVKVEGIEPSTNEITIDDFFAVEIKVENRVVKYNGKELKVGEKNVKVDRVENGKVR